MMAAPTLKTQDYDDAGATLNALAAEAAFFHYTVSHEFNRPAECTLILNGDQTTVRKYDVDAAGDSVYVGPGGAEVTDEDGNQIFYGRMLKARFNAGNNTLEIPCRDWMDQLSEEHITHDMREDLDGAGLRQSQVRSNNDAGADASNAPAQESVGTKYIYDDGEYDDPAGMGWAADQWDGYYLVFPAEMAGSITSGAGPYDKDVTEHNDGIDTDEDAFDETWLDDDNSDHTTDDDSDFEIEYHMRGWLYDSDWNDGTTKITLTIVYQMTGAAVSGTIQFEDQTNPGNQLNISTTMGTGTIQTVTQTFPKHQWDNLMDADGNCTIWFNIVHGGAAAHLYVYYLWLEVSADTSGYSTATEILGTGANFNTTGTDFTLDATKVWEQMPYCICDKIRNHISGIVTAGDPLVTLDRSLADTTTGISSKYFEEETRLGILQYLAKADKACFWVDLDDATPTVIWKGTWATADPTDLTDAMVLRWRGEWDYVPVFNEAHVYGIRIGDNQLYDEGTSATSKTTYGVTRTKVVRDQLVSKYDCGAVGTAIVEANDDALLFLQCDIAGLSSFRLGDEADVTCTRYNLSDAKYVVSHFSYDSRTAITTLRLHPRADLSTHGLTDHHLFGQRIRASMEETKRLSQSHYTPPPASDVV